MQFVYLFIFVSEKRAGSNNVTGCDFKNFKKFNGKTGVRCFTGKRAFIVIENIIDNGRTKSSFGVLMSLNMLIKDGDGFDFSLSDFEAWAKEAGFKRTELKELAGPTSATIAYKN